MTTSAKERVWRALLLCALVFKALYLAQYAALPFLFGPLFDAPVYLHQAESVRAGRFGDPALVAFSPLYGYLLALVDRPGAHGRTVLLQLTLGLLNLELIRRITARWFDDATAMLTAALYLGYGLLVFYETKLMSETLGITLLLCALVVITSRGFLTARSVTCIAGGAVLAFATLARASLLPALPWFALVALLRWGAADPVGADVSERARRAAYLAFGLMLVLGLHGAWTKHHTGLFVPVIMVSKTAAQATSAGEWKGTFAAFSSDKSGMVSAWNVVEQARERIRRAKGGEAESPSGPFAGIDALGFLQGAPSKAWLTLRDTETTFDYGYYGERSEVPMLNLAPVSFGLLLVLALLGFALLWRDGKAAALWPLAPVVIGVFCTTTLFHPSSRYRLPLVLTLMPLAAYALVQAVRLPSPRLRAAVSAYAAVAITYFAFATYTRPLSHPAMWELRVAEAAAVGGFRDEARQRLDKAVALAPDNPSVQNRVRYIEAMLNQQTRSHSR